VVKDSGEFAKSSANKSGKQSYCKACARNYNQTPERKAYFQIYGQRPDVKARQRSYSQILKESFACEELTLVCNKCKESKSQHEFSKSKTRKYGRCPTCKDCVKNYNQRPDRKVATYEYNQIPEIKSRRKKEQLKYNQSKHGRYKHIQFRAQYRGIDFAISESFHAELLMHPCAYCGGSLNLTGSGMGRMDSSKGYIMGNVIPCCKDCNTVKSDVLSHEEMIAAMSAVLALRGVVIKIKSADNHAT
jgi:hypothetical protein